MVGAGTTLLAVAMLGAVLWIRRRAVPDDRRFLKLLVAVSPLGLVAIEAGWTVTEVGRQPWIVYGVMRTRDAVTPMPGLVVPLVTIATLYVFIGVIVLALLRRQVFAAPRGAMDSQIASLGRTAGHATGPDAGTAASRRSGSHR